MSDAAALAYESISAAARLTTPPLMIHGDRFAVPDAVRRQFPFVPTPDRQLLWDPDTRHLQYDDTEVIDRAVCDVVDWFARHLGRG